MTALSTIAVETRAGGATAFRAASLSTSAAFQHQKLTHTERGNSWGLCAPIPAVVYDNVRDWSAIGRAGLPGADAPNLLINWRGLNCAPSFSHPHRLPVLPRSSRKRVCLLPPGQPRAYSLRLADCSPLLRNTLPYQQISQCLADRRHVSSLSSSVAFAGFQPSEAPNGRAHNSRADLQKSEGELPDVRC